MGLATGAFALVAFRPIGKNAALPLWLKWCPRGGWPGAGFSPRKFTCNGSEAGSTMNAIVIRRLNCSAAKWAEAHRRVRVSLMHRLIEQVAV